MLIQGQILSYEDEVGTKIPEEHFAVRDKGLGFGGRGQGSGVRSQNRGQISRFRVILTFFFRSDQLVINL